MNCTNISQQVITTKIFIPIRYGFNLEYVLEKSAFRITWLSIEIYNCYFCPIFVATLICPKLISVNNRTLLILVFWIGTILPIHAQGPEGNERIVEGGKTFLVHSVKAGETLYSIGRFYNVDREVIVSHNPQAANGLKTGEKLKIPVKSEVGEIPLPFGDKGEARIILHKVQRKETFYFISRKYGITIDDILAYNPGVSQLKRGDTLRIPQWGKSTTQPVLQNEEQPLKPGTSVTHWVQPGETLYSISRKYGVSVASILDENPDSQKLKPGMRLTISAGNDKSAVSAKNTERFIEHTIVRGETLYAVCKKFGVTAERLLELNPGLNKTFKAGNVILIPEKVAEPEKVIVDDEPTSVRHVVIHGETLYSLSKHYHVEISDIIRNNPVLESRTPRLGDTLLIVNTTIDADPMEEERKIARSEADCMEVKRNPSGRGSIRIALLLPIMLETNLYLNSEFRSVKKSEEPDSEAVEGETMSAKKETFIQFHGNSENFIHFYEGALLAVDSLRAGGVKVDLDVYDTEQKTSKVSSLVSSGVLDQADLIIGPVFPDQQKAISAFASGKGVPVISPLSASDEFTQKNPLFFQVNPPREFIARKRAGYVISAFINSNVLVLKTNSGSADAESEAGYLNDELREKGGLAQGTTVRIIDYQQEGFSGLKSSLSKDRKNVVVIPSDKEAEVSVAVSNIKALASEFDITLVGSNRFPQFDSINPDHFHQGKLEFLTPYWPDFSRPVARSFVNKFRTYFKAEPNQFSMQGYDVVFFFAKAMHDFGPDCVNCISFTDAELVQGNYHFERLSPGGYLNDGLHVIQYTPHYQVVRKKGLHD